MNKMAVINGWDVDITMLLYITFIGGILAQIGMGVLQLVCFFILCFNYKKLNNKLRIHLSIYAISTLSLLLYASFIAPDFMILWYPSGILMLYFFFITLQIQK